MHAYTRLQRAFDSFVVLGVPRAVLYWTQWLRSKLIRDQRLLTVTTKETAFPLSYRANTSDRGVFRQIFLAREYSCVDDLTNVGLVVDCGANVGFSAAYFLNKFPTCEVLAIEPDPDSFRVLARNLQPYEGRWTALNSAVWSHPTGLKLVDTYRDGEAWGRQTRETSPGEPPDVFAIDIGSLLRDSHYDRISLLKVDIEGAESVVFSDAPWIQDVDNIVIEFHLDTGRGDCGAVFYKAIAGRRYKVSQRGERTICRSDR